jgi:hypothetical protein
LLTAIADRSGTGRGPLHDAVIGMLELFAPPVGMDAHQLELRAAA